LQARTSYVHICKETILCDSDATLVGKIERAGED
jgi:hypothetical protein